jgi:hypothetical protein
MSLFETRMSLGHNDECPVTVHYTAHAATPDEPAWIGIEYVSMPSPTGPLLINLSKPDENMLRERIAEYLDEIGTP